MDGASSAVPARLILCGLLTIAAAGSGLAQDGPSATIDGFRGLRWGVTPTEIEASFGPPLESQRMDGGLHMIAYRDSLAGRPSVVLFGLLDDVGLVKGQEVIDAGDGEACIEYIRAVHEAVNLRFPLIRPNEQAKNNSRDAICEAAAEGMAFWYRQWRDEQNGSVVTVRLDSGSDEVNLIYESQVFRQWADIDTDVGVVPDDGRAEAEDINPVP
ncbi:MAG: hypothetical protein ACR2GQ_10920 [Gemmatimonadota bacterium]